MKPIKKSKNIYHFKNIFCGLLYSLLFNSGINAENQNMYSTAFFYDKNLPLELLEKYNRVVVEPENTTSAELSYLKSKGVRVYAYLSIGEVRSDRPWFNGIDKNWILGANIAWNSKVMDLSNIGWRNYLVNNLTASLRQNNFPGIFLDTLDSYQLVTKTTAETSAQQQGIIKLIKQMKKKFPGIHLLFNRGFEILDEVATLSDGIVAESLFSGWNPATSNYQKVSSENHQWLLKKLNTVRRKYKLPITVIDYLPLNQQEKAIEIAKQIDKLGFTPWVSTFELNTVGIGALNLVP